MATLTLYDGTTGDPVRPNQPTLPGPVSGAADDETVTFALDPTAGRALVRFVAGPDDRPLQARVQLGEGEDQRAMAELIREELDGSGYHLASPDRVPSHLNVVHYLADPDPPWPDSETRRRLVRADDPVEVEVPSAAAAVGVADFVSERAPWKDVAVHPASASAGSVDADVAVAVNPDAGNGRSRSRGEGDVDESAGSDDRPGDATAATATTNGGDRESDADGVLRIYEASTGELAYDSRFPREPPATESETAARTGQGEVALFVDPGPGVLRTVMEACGEGATRRFVAEYERSADGGDLLASFARELQTRVDDLGVAFSVVVGDDQVAFERFADADPPRPAGLPDEVLTCLDRIDGPVEVAAPSGEAAVELVAFLRRHRGAETSATVRAGGRPDSPASTDIVVAVDPTSEGFELRGDAATRLAELRLEERLADARSAIGVLVDQIDGITGTPAARQRYFAATLSRGALSRCGLALLPADGRPFARLRSQSLSVTLYWLLAVGVTVGAVSGQRDLLSGSDGRTVVDPGPLARLPVTAAQQSYTVDGTVVAVASLAVILLGACWLAGFRPVPRQTRPALASTEDGREPEDSVQARLSDLREAYEGLGELDGTSDRRPAYPTFLEQHLFARPGLPRVEVVTRRRRWMRMLANAAGGSLAGAVVAAGVLGTAWVAVTHLPPGARVPLEVLVGLAGVVLLASIAKAVVVVTGTMSRTIHRHVSSVRRS